MTSGLDRLESMFADTRNANRGALMPFVVGGHPRPGSLADVLSALQKAGADAVEIGFPFSDPIADGPVVAAAMHEALQEGATPQGVLEEVAAARSLIKMCLISMVSVSIVERLGGPASFVERAASSGFDGFIFPDIAVEEAEPYVHACAAARVGCSLLIAPSTPIDRLRTIVEKTSGFVYLLARAGITGERRDAPDVAGRVRALRGVTGLPIAVGFGISSSEHVRSVVEHADAAIVGSALVRRMSEHTENAAAEAERFVSELRPGCERGG
ncbi:MAG: tryptophan synthase subunit alpha [Planctomycetota bacterium]